MYSVAYNPTETGGTNDFVSLSSVSTSTGDASFGTSEGSEDQFAVPVALILNNLYVEVDTAPGAGNDNWVITLREDGGSETLTCDIDETATTCTDTANDSSIAGGAKVNFLVSSEDGGGADPTAAAEMIISFCATPN